jgi:lysophospholipase L1-like esterase
MEPQKFHAAFDFGSGPAEQGYTKVSSKDLFSEEAGFGFVPLEGIEIQDANQDGSALLRDFCYSRLSGVPLQFDVRVPHNGTYHVKLTFFNPEKSSTLTVLSESRRFMLTDQHLPAGEVLTCEFTANVCDFHMNGDDYTKKDRLNIAILGTSPQINALEITEVDVPTIYMAGDSTVTDQKAEYPYHPSSTYCGWGQMLGQFLHQGIAVSNHAQSGSTTQDFKECNWNVVKERLKPGDFLFVEFGHNDQKIEALDAFGGYAENLRFFVREARALGAVPVLCTSINRILFQEDGTLMNLLGDYGEAVRQVGRELDVPVIDLLQRTTEFFETVGPVDSWNYFWGDGKNRDYTHTNDIGGNVIARFAAQEIIKNKIHPVCDLIKADQISVPIPPRSEAAHNTSKDLNPISNVGLVNLPKQTSLQDIDKDISDL